MPKLLVVDDSATMRKIVIKTIRDAGIGTCEFIEAADGVEALEALSKNDVDLILSDINMPNMDGIHLVRCVRDQMVTENIAVGDNILLKKIRNTIPILMISTEGGLGKVQEALAAGANDYVKKPFTPEQLKEKMSSLLR
ncbi:MAG: response regulator [Planctomycetota bacterium]